MTEIAIDAQIRRNAIPRGLILGCILLALNIFAFYFITATTDQMLLIMIGPFFLTMLVPIFVAAYLCFDLRKSIGGFWVFKKAVTGIFIMFLVAYLMLAVGRDLIFARVIVPDMVQKTGKVMIDTKKKALEKSGTPKAEIDRQIAETQKDFDASKNTSLLNTIVEIAITIIFVFIIALVFGALFKKDPPVLTAIITEDIT